MTKGKIAYEVDCDNCPNYHDGLPRKTWDNPTIKERNEIKPC